MMNAVIYARYSSHGQKETSIEGQLKVIHEYAKREGYNVIREYIDRALTGKNDNRPEFQKMIRDSAQRRFDFVLVYSLDRFARDRYDNAIYKARLKKHGIRVVSATESISDDPAGIMVEGVLESMAEYYSAELSQKVRRGIAISVENHKFIGGYIPLGYSVSEDKRYIINPLTAQIVQKCFELAAAGQSFKEIGEAITRDHGTARFGNVCNSLNRILSNRNYIGIYTRCGKEEKDGMPRIVSDELFERVQSIMAKNKKAPARARAHAEYLLTTKLFCGYCREMMVGVSGTSKTGIAHNYYTCKSVWKKKGCKKKNVRKEYIEKFIFSIAREQLTDENIALFAAAVSEISKRENNTGIVAEIKKKLKENAAAIENLLKAIESGEHMELLSERITQKKDERAELEKALANEQMKTNEIDENEIKFFLAELKKGNIEDIVFQRALITIFINAIYLYDDHATIIFNASDKPTAVDYDLLDGIEKDLDKGGNRGSYMKDTAPPIYTLRQLLKMGCLFAWVSRADRSCTAFRSSASWQCYYSNPTPFS
jgi:DNA invertase Pin-like site-specific DNA recombinase